MDALTERLHTEANDSRDRGDDWRLIGTNLHWDIPQDYYPDEEPPLSKYEE